MKLSMGKKWVVRRQEGFTLVNIAGLVVSSGIAMGVAVQGTDIVSDVQKGRFYEDLQVMENHVWEHKERLGYWPGDCNRDGLIGFQPQSDQKQLPAAEAAKSCASGSQEDQLTAFADMQAAGVVDQDVSLQEIKKHSQEGDFRIGYGMVQNKKSNVIVAYNVPADIAKWVDMSVDGGVDGQQGRVRRWDQSQDGSNWSVKGQKTVSLAYYFERKI